MTYTLPNGYTVRKLVSNPDKTVTLNDEKTMPLKEFHSLGGLVALFHEHAHDYNPWKTSGKCFTPYR